MQFDEFAARAAEIESESADLAVVSLLAALFRDSGDDLSTVARFVQGRVFPAWDSTTLDIGPRLCHEAIARAAGTNVSAADVEDRLADLGEIGAVAESYDFGGQRGLAAFGNGGQDGLTVTEVDSELRSVAAASGSGSEETKLKTLYGLFNRTDPEEARFLARLVLSEMRIGVGEGSVRDAIAEAFLVSPEDAAAIRDDDVDSKTEAAARERRDDAIASVARALQVSNDYGMVAAVTRDEGESGLDEVRLEVGRPVQAMLAQAGTAADALDEWGTAAVETKFDGARVQVHHDESGDVSLFSRNMEDVTGALPEVVEFVEETVAVPVILDGEVVAMDDDGEPLPFQEILRRFRRKHDVGRMREEVRVELRAFDCLHADGDDLLTEPLTTRHDRLSSLLGQDSDAVSDVLLSDDADEIAAYEADVLDAGHEGIMLKNPVAPYSPGDRGKNWLKRKPDVETLDLVVTGAEWGEGRRAKFLGTFLLSARVEDQSGSDGFETIGKVATGITDDQLVELTDLLEPEIERESGQEVDVRPSVVFEVGYEEIQQSPTYSSGYALRFPRFVSVREDKTAETADTLERVERLAASQ
ncbi:MULTISPECIES: ATP-dependent DNA ligase LigA [Haloferax]|uniref:DNA ligase n=1 Tax=Haloferax marinum TaxID=2666143 RepID=A0A6A8G281_9EURY|nr:MULTISPECIES: ATP-dependent DNA ligase LigA [Haloferax]KAB1196222.1 ATP-dependent DNA ligase [Haloferax sp. CBA1150]MRW95210.1 ATP-dependent DNA ligase [Haloferax marinum]